MVVYVLLCICIGEYVYTHIGVYINLYRGVHAFIQVYMEAVGVRLAEVLHPDLPHHITFSGLPHRCMCPRQRGFGALLSSEYGTYTPVTALTFR